MMKATVMQGDCLTLMAAMPEASVDAIVTDPPYGLGFMGKAWDALPPGEEWARTCLSILKPGGHLLAFGGSRTWHRLACAVEDAGFEVRDSIAWLYGSGFPKSLDVSKAIDKAGGDAGQRLFRDELKRAIEVSGMTFADIDRALGVKSTSCYWVREDHRASLPAPHHWANLGDLLPLSDDLRSLYVECERAVIGSRFRAATGRAEQGSGGYAFGEVFNETAPATAAAQRWEGWGTTLRPAFEPIVVARKPLVGPVAVNVLQHGTGALNINGCRIGPEASSGGRWPTNIVLDESQVSALEAQRTGASRFFYAAKASSGERPVINGVAHPTVKPLELMRWLVRLVTPPGGTVLDPFAGSGTTLEAALLEGFQPIGFELANEYIPLIQARIERVEGAEVDLFGGVA